MSLPKQPPNNRRLLRAGKNRPRNDMFFAVTYFILDSPCFHAYNPSHSEVVSEKCLIEKEMQSGSLLRKSSLKSSDHSAEEIFVKLERHGNARYSMD